MFQIALLGPLVSMAGSRKMGMVGHRPNKDLAFIAELLEMGSIVPLIGRSYSLSEVPDALRYFGGGQHHGKIVITMEQ